LQFFATRIRQSDDTPIRIADLSETIDVAIALETSDAFAKLPLPVRSTYTRAPVTSRGNSLSVLARWAEQHANGKIVDGSELTTSLVARDRLLLFEDRSRLATLYLWLAQRFPEIYVNGAAMTRMRESIDQDIHDALLEHGARDPEIVRQEEGSAAIQQTPSTALGRFDDRSFRS
jgi:hypothetical protein